MRKIRGFLVKHRVNTIFRCFFRRSRSSKGYKRLNPPSPCWRVKSISRFLSWTSNLKTKAKSICCCPSTNSSVPGRVTSGGHMQIGHDPHGKQGQQGRQPVAVPKGHMAVYVGQKDGDFQRVLIPVVYFNHPLFGQLLREAEEEFGYNHPGAITIPCRISEFEHVQTRIKQGQPTRRLLSWKREA